MNSRRVSLFWKIYSSFFGISFLFLLAVAALTFKSFTTFYEQNMQLSTVETVHSALYNLYFELSLGFLGLLVAVALASYIISARISKSLEMIKVYAQEVADGDFSKRIDLKQATTLEAYELGQAMNDISVQLKKRLKKIVKQKNLQESVFSSLQEGIIAVGFDKNVLKVNQTAADILKVKKYKAKGSPLTKIIKNKDLRAMILESLENSREYEMEVYTDQNQCLLAYTRPLMTMSGDRFGVLLVVDDITKLKELENHRSEFVANVSHELRTPLTSIQGFTETLLTNDVDEVQQKSFLKIIQDQSARLSTVLEDLLSLSKLEKDSEGVETTPQKIGPVVQTAIQVCEPKAKKLHVDFEFEGDDQIIVNINSLLFEQALVNLIDNAIKYGRPQDGKNKGSVKVKIDQDDQSVRVSVIDQGKGIDNEHLSRLFERFYRVDKARSRNIGGTGLGLSIVKHIALAHKGSVKVESQLGQGSKFSIILPKNHELT